MASSVACCVCVVGTRPEAIKLAPIIKLLARTPWAKPVTVTTGQQSDLLDNTLCGFGIQSDVGIPYETPLDLGSNLARIIERLDQTFQRIGPQIVIAQGDTTTALAACMAAFYRRIPFVHVEAGLRSGELNSPYPEEYHRRMIAISAAINCAPTERAAQNLINEKVSRDTIHVTGNTVIDALLQTARAKPPIPAQFPKGDKTILLTTHRRESFGQPMREALSAVRSFLDANPDVSVFFPVHPNPTARDVALDVLGSHPQAVLNPALSYRDLVASMQKSWVVLTDSGGLQEEAPALGKPVLILRDSTERPEMVEAGAARIVGTRRASVIGALSELAQSSATYQRMARPAFPYGKGNSAGRIVGLLPSIL
ncbi:non-hydrolyzing UDP-N-acetylglucosamine 2-epimerase [Rhodopseudomonas pseudopalustris]|uniref:UDP-N-acetylglucosamine 2-epimerase (non-hydrolyzing) n=1 Tax=Rhodopseudomonas pseudopalustris TaxID=1513892 RepID=A0A1H8T148_9BRAD|nr:UDP-N-acetylglucosamine 2-epimerase (non-hydrolyzing) [Rhodopseudomonas pseudopalustris]SEO84759.1 UDP-N-Acetylglucosamine 2-epimerase [Rhodopseudomonas pseudopalustris]